MEWVKIIADLIEQKTGIPATYFLSGFLFFLLGALFVIGLIAFRSKQSGADITINLFGIFSFSSSPNKRIQELEEDLRQAYEEYNIAKADSEYKDKIMEYLNELSLSGQKIWGLILRKKVDFDEIRKAYTGTVNYIMPAILECIRKNARAHYRIGIYVKDPEQENMLKLEEPVHGYSLAPRHLPMESHAGKAYTEQKPVVTNSKEERRKHAFPFFPKSEERYESLACIPIPFAQSSIGVLNVDCSEQNAFGDYEVDILTYFANQFSQILALYLFVCERNKKKKKILSISRTFGGR